MGQWFDPVGGTVRTAGATPKTERKQPNIEAAPITPLMRGREGHAMRLGAGAAAAGAAAAGAAAASAAAGASDA